MPIDFTNPLSGVWKPHPRQEDFIRIPFDVTEALYGGAAGGGKSELLMFLPLVYNFHLHPRFHGIIFRRTFPQLEQSLILRSKDIYKYFGAEYNESRRFWRFPSGAILRFSYMETDDDARAHDTAEYNYIAFDELTHFDAYQYKYLLSRLRSSVKDLPAIMRSASNPGNIGHAWVRDRFIDPAREGYKLIKETTPNGSIFRIFIPAKVADNPTLLQNSPQYLSQLALLPEAERKAKMDGDWYSFSGQVFTELRTSHVPGEPENAIHVVEPFPIPDWWPKVLAIDWGFTAMTWAGWGAIAPDKRIFVYREYVARKTPIDVWGSDIARLSQFDDNLISVIVDPSAWQQRGTPLTIAEQFEKVSGLLPQKADNDRLGGKMLIHDLLRWKPRPARYVPKEGYLEETYSRIFRMHGQKAADEYKKMFLPEVPETNIPRLQFFSHCTTLLKTLPLCVYSERRPEDIEEFPGDDPIDGLRYLVKGIDRFERMVTDQAKKFERVGKVMQQFEQTGDYNYLHRAMEKVESEVSRNTFGTHRGRRARLSRAFRRPNRNYYS